MLWNILTHTPLFVWPLLALLIWGGLRARKEHTVSWKALLLFPSILCAWSVYSALAQASALSLGTWAGSLGLGIWLGYLTVNRLSIRFDTARNALVIPGSYIPLLLSLSIFALRYALGAAHALVPAFADSLTSLTLNAGASLVSGMFLGRLLGYKLRLKSV